MFSHSFTRLLSYLLVIFVCVLPANDACPATGEDIGQRTDVPGFSMDVLRGLAEVIERRGIGVDSIPAISRPQFVSVSDASLSMDDDEVVFVIHYPDGTIRIYPQRILVWHEVVNDTLPDKKEEAPAYRLTPDEPKSDRTYTITYSPLTGTVTAFRSFAGRYPSTFGVTGDLLNANSILYDRTSISLWSQLLAACIEGPLRGKRLERIPVLWAKWSGVKVRYAGTAEVLSRSTGHKRSYGKDPYGSYSVKGTYYDNNMLANPLTFLDKRLPLKTRILGLELDELYGALQVEYVKQEKIFNFTMGIVPLVAIYDQELDAVRVFDRRLDGKENQTLTFEVFEDKYIDTETRSVWHPEGYSTYGRNREKKLSPVFTIDSMWFAWSAFHRATLIFPYQNW